MDLVVNVTENWGIGRQGRLLLSLPGDLRQFRALTLGKTVVLGRKTLQTFPGGRPLAGRENLVLSTRPDFQVEGAQVVGSLPRLLELLAQRPREQIAVIGGGEVYAALLPWCDRALVTHSRLTMPADRFFPDLTALPGWYVHARGPEVQEQGICWQLVEYRNRSPRPLARG